MCFPEKAQDDVGVGIQYAKDPEEHRPPQFSTT